MSPSLHITFSNILASDSNIHQTLIVKYFRDFHSPPKQTHTGQEEYATCKQKSLTTEGAGVTTTFVQKGAIGSANLAGVPVPYSHSKKTNQS